ncbi:MAG: AAA family ATPase [Candidatus Accumulibacter sp.]|nr:AAA family ATPase [Accumulibacter sp.]
MLTDVTIEGLRGVGRVELGFVPGQRVYVLFGENGVGKTKCLEALYQSLLAANKEPLLSVLIDDSGLRIGNVSPKEWFKWVMERIQPEPDVHQLPVLLLGAARRASLNPPDRPIDARPLGSFERRRQEYFDSLSQPLRSGRLDGLGMTGDTREWFVRRAQSTNPYQKSADARSVEIDAVLAMLHEMEPSIDAKALQIDGDGQVFLRVAGRERELGELSSGFAALLKMVQAIIAGYAAFTNAVQLQNVPGIVLIDEIDAHLHPSWQAQIIPCLKDLLPDTIFYIATHSPLVLTQLKDGEAYLLERGEDDVVRSRVVEGTSRRLFVDMLKSAFGVNTNQLKLQSMERNPEQNQKAKRRLLELLESTREAKV